MKSINPWINFNGNALEAFNFYRSVFGGEFSKVQSFGEQASEDFQVTEHEANKILYISLPLGKANELIGNDVPEFMGKVNENENRSKILIDAESREEAEKLFNGLSEGGEVEGSMGEGPWGNFTAMFRDKFGIEWIIDFDPKG